MNTNIYTLLHICYQTCCLHLHLCLAAVNDTTVDSRYIHAYMCEYVCIYTHMYMCVYICIYVHMYICIHTYIRTYIHTCVHTYMLYLRTYMHACIHACAFWRSSLWLSSRDHVQKRQFSLPEVFWSLHIVGPVFCGFRLRGLRFRGLSGTS